MTFAN